MGAVARDAMTLGRVSEASKDEPRATNNVLRVNGAKVSAVKACGCAAKEEELARSKNTAALPMRQWSLSGVCFQGPRQKSAAGKHVGTVPADASTADSCDKLQQVGGAPQIAPTSSQHSCLVRQAHDREIASSWRFLLDPIEADCNTGRLVPNDQRVPLGHDWRKQQDQGEDSPPERLRHHAFSPEEERRRACSSHSRRSSTW
jgi:hypothetical protein